MVYLIDVAKDGFLDALVLDNLTQDTAVTAADDKNLLGIGVGVHGKVGDHLLVATPRKIGQSDSGPPKEIHCPKGTYANSSRSVH